MGYSGQIYPTFFGVRGTLPPFSDYRYKNKVHNQQIFGHFSAGYCDAEVFISSATVIRRKTFATNIALNNILIILFSSKL